MAPIRSSPPPPTSPADEVPTSPLDVTIADSDREQVKVNNVNLTELKNACDDALKRVCAPTLPCNPLYLINLPSISPTQNYSLKTIPTLMSASHWVGRA
jgi:hypothetical protein